MNVEKIYLFGSFAYGKPRQDSEFDIYVLLRDGRERPIRAIQKINLALARMDIRSVDILADTSDSFYEKSKGLTLERVVARKGMPLYESSNRDCLLDLQ
ncbi:MAG: nucleotidyltransferase domain-containing protein [Lachnospiraceae bacterium]|nr:nucleotidyltransferase domain-containing protein [Lachnospiraceae bacterium]